MFRIALGILSLVGLAVSQSAAPYTDSDIGITFVGITDPDYNVTRGYIFPPVNSTTTPDEFIGEIIAPVAVQWTGLSPGGAMIGNILLVAWAYGGTILSSSRYATAYSQPSIYTGPILTDLPGTAVNATHWKWVFRCQNCTTWTNGSLITNSAGVAAWAASTAAVNTPSDPSSTLHKHTDFGLYAFDFTTAHACQEDYDIWAAGETGGTARMLA